MVEVDLVDAGAQRDHRRDLLAVLLVGEADDRGDRDGVVLEQRVLDLGGADVLAAADDGVVGATLAEHVALDVEPAAVAGVEPAVGVDLRVGAHVLAAHLVALDQDLARLVGAERVARLVDDAELDARHRLAHRPEAGGEERLVAVEREAVVVGSEDGDGAAGLGEAVGVDEVDLGEEHQRAPEDRRVHLGAAVRQRPQRRDPQRLVGLHGLDDLAEHGRHEHGVGDALVARGDQPVLGREAHAGHGHDAPTDVGVAEHRGDAGDVERRHHHDGGFVLAGRRELERVEDVGEQLVVLEDRGLGLGRRAAGEEEHRGGVGRVGEGAVAAALVVEPVRGGDDRRLDAAEQRLELRSRAGGS